MAVGLKRYFAATMVTLCLGVSAQVFAQETRTESIPPDADRDQTWYQTRREEASDVKAIIHDKARRRGEERTARLETVNWYQNNSARPTVAPMRDMGPWVFVPFPPGQVANYWPWVCVGPPAVQGVAPVRGASAAHGVYR